METNIKINDEVLTQHGKGTVVEIEQLSTTVRYGVRLDEEQFNFLPFYWPQRVKRLVSPTLPANEEAA